MKFRIIYLFIALLSYSPATICSTEIKSISVISDDNYPPYIFRDTKGQLQGIIVDQWQLWEKKTGIKVYLEGMNWRDALYTMQEGHADVLETVFYNEERARIYDFSRPYAKLEVPVFFHKTLSGITDIKTLRGFTVAVKSGDACINILRDNGITSLKEYDSYEDIIKAASAGEVRVFSIDKPPALYYLYKMDLEDDFKYSFNLYTGEFHRAVKKGRRDLLKNVEDGFALISKAELNEIEEKWMGKPILSTKYIHYALYILAIASAIVIIMAIINIILRRKVNQKTMELKNTLEELSKSEARNKAMLNANPDLLFVFSRDGRIIDYKADDVSSLYVRPEVFLGKNVNQILPPDIAALTMEKISAVSESGNYQTYDYNLNMGALEYYESRLVKCSDTEFLAIVRNITDRKHTEEELKAAKEHAEEMNRLKSSFLANMSHELRTPLVALLGFSQLLDSELTGEYKEYAASINRSGKRLLRTLNSILDYSEIEFDKLDLYLSDIDLIHLLEEEANLYRMMAQNKGLYLKLETEANSIIIASDERLLRGIIDNLINNAVKFTSNGGITIKAYRTLDEVIVRVHDSGVGIPEDKLQLIFEEFRQASEGSTRNFQGTGLGLTIARRYAQKLNGIITVESEQGKGSVFSFYMPLK